MNKMKMLRSAGPETFDHKLKAVYSVLKDVEYSVARRHGNGADKDKLEILVTTHSAKSLKNAMGGKRSYFYVIPKQVSVIL